MKQAAIAASRCTAVAASCLLAAMAAHAASITVGPSANVPLTAGVNLDFTIGIERFIFFRIGDGALPTPGGTRSTASFVLTPSIPGGPTTPVTGNNTHLNWSGAAPTFSVASNGNVLPVEVRSNAGAVTLYATVSTPLVSGANTLPMSVITVSSDNTSLPAPTIPASGSSTSVSVPSTDSTGLVTVRTATWTFSYVNSASRTAGNYLGTVAFTASSP